jgi:hypothetical protein
VRGGLVVLFLVCSAGLIESIHMMQPSGAERVGSDPGPSNRPAHIDLRLPPSPNQEICELLDRLEAQTELFRNTKFPNPSILEYEIQRMDPLFSETMD